jgi:hypothetical protein
MQQDHFSPSDGSAEAGGALGIFKIGRQKRGPKRSGVEIRPSRSQINKTLVFKDCAMPAPRAVPAISETAITPQRRSPEVDRQPSRMDGLGMQWKGQSRSVAWYVLCMLS